jgi:hypothetical protein
MGPNRNTESSYTGIVYDRVVRIAHNFGTSLRQADGGGGAPKSKPVSGVKTTAVKMPRATPVEVFHAEASGSEDESVQAPQGDISFTLKDLEVALANVRVDGGPPVSETPRASTLSWQMTPSSRSPPASVVSIPSRGWASPAGSVRAQPALPRGRSLQRPRIRRPPLCYVCYQLGHWLADFSSLPVEVRRAAQQNREAHLKASPAPIRGPPAYSQYGQASPIASDFRADANYAPKEGLGGLPGILPDGRSAWPPVDGET